MLQSVFHEGSDPEAFHRRNRRARARAESRPAEGDPAGARTGRPARERGIQGSERASGNRQRPHCDAEEARRRDLDAQPRSHPARSRRLRIHGSPSRRQRRHHRLSAGDARGIGLREGDDFHLVADRPRHPQQGGGRRGQGHHSQRRPQVRHHQDFHHSRRVSPYSPERRTALVLCGTGAHGAYHAGVLRALHEAGVKIDVVAGQGIGAGGAALAAIGGGSRVWEDSGVWRSPRVKSLYAWKPVTVVLPLALVGLITLLLATVVATALGWNVPAWWVATLIVLCAATATGCVLLVRRHAAAGRRAAGRWWWRLIGSPIEAESARTLFLTAIWDLIRGAAPVAQPGRGALGRRYTEVLQENLGQPGF